jgi:surface carbohydrate biosynthesis protein
MRDRYLIIPSENRTREFDAKLLTACCAVEAGYGAIVGCRRDIHLSIDRLPRSIYIGKDLRASSARMMRILTRLGHRIVAWDEEGLVYYTPEHYLAARVDASVLDACSLLLAWGGDNAEIWRNAPQYDGTPIREVGNPRIDLLRPELHSFHQPEIDAIKQRFGRYILVNSNFGSVNHVLSDGASATFRRLGSDRAADYQKGALQHRRILFERFLDAVPALAEARPDYAIVVRPHPSENPLPWELVAQRHRNVHIRHEGGIVPWLMGAEAIVHNGCTTAVESAILGRRAISYQPIVNDTYDIPLPNALSDIAPDLDTLIDLLRRPQRNIPGDCAAVLRRHVTSLDGPLSSDRVIAAIETLAPLKRQGAGLLRTLRGSFQASRRRRSKIAASDIVGHKDGDAYNAHRFPPISLAEVQARVAQLQQCLGRFGRVGVQCLQPNVFELRRAA